MGMPIITPSTTSRPQAITDIIESIALEETALSHILNAEGEKLQKIIATSSNTTELIKVNKSVEQMVNSISRLELTLQSKLELFSDCLCPLTSTTTTTTTTSASTTTTTTTSCAPITNINITTTSGATVNKVNNTNFSLDLSTGTPTFTVVPTPSNAPVLFTTVPNGVTTSGNNFTINSTVTLAGTVVFTVGSGTCKQTITVQYATAV